MAQKDEQKLNASFPPDIIREILLKLPVESLLRCKSVCKEWYSLISDQHFIKSHCSLSSTNTNYAHHRLICNTSQYHQQRSNLVSCPLYEVLFNESVNNAIQLENPLQRTCPKTIRIVGSCNGLVCILVEDDNTLFIYNPSTRRTNILPGCKEGAFSLGVLYGFGYDEMTHDYKVVKLDPTWPRWDTMIYSLKAESWKEIGLFPCPDPLHDGKFLNGALHWATGVVRSRKIVSLDLGKETYGEVLQPEYDEGKGFFKLEVSGEWLCVLCDYFENRVVDVWVMKVYGMKDSWTKLASIQYPHIWGPQIFLAPFCISEYWKLLLQFEKKLVVYDSKDNSFSVIDNECIDACIVVESLVSPFPSEAALLAKLGGIRPFPYGLVVQTVYANGSVFSPEVLNLTEDDLVEKFAVGVSMVTSLSLAIHYPTIAAAPHMLINGYKNALAFAVETEYSFTLADKVKEYLADPSKFAVAASGGAAAASGGAAAFGLC